MNAHGPDVLGFVEAAYREHFEVVPARASVSFVGVDPIEILRYADDTADTFVEHFLSLGMSRYPMADAAELVVDPSTAPRAELMMSAIGQPKDLWRRLAILAAAPAVEGAVYAVGNRIDLGEPLSSGSRCTGGLLATGPLSPITVPGTAEVAVLRVIPATANELAWARVHGSEALHQRWADARTDLTDLARDAVELD